MRLTQALLACALLTLPLAHAQGNATSDPTVNSSEMDTSAPPADDAYLNDTNASSTATDNGTAADNSTTDPTLSSSDLDTSVPTSDTSWLTDSPATPSDATPAATGSAPAAKTPGFETVALVGAVALAALVVARRR